MSHPIDRYPAYGETTEDGRVEVTIHSLEGRGRAVDHGELLGPFDSDEEAERAARLAGATSYNRKIFTRTEWRTTEIKGGTQIEQP